MRALSGSRLQTVAGLITGALLLFALSYWRDAVSTPVALTLPFPAPGGTISESLSLYRKGWFEAAIVTPVPPMNRVESSRDRNPVRCEILIRVRGEGHVVTKNVRALQAFDWTKNLVTWKSDDFFALNRGDYLVSVTNVDGKDPVLSKGAFIELDRIETNGVDWLPLLLACAAFGLLLVAIGVLLTTPTAS